MAKGLEPSLEAVRAEKSFAEASAKVNTIRAAIQEINDRRTIAIQEHNAEILQELAEANLELSKLEKLFRWQLISQIEVLLRVPQMEL